MVDSFSTPEQILLSHRECSKQKELTRTSSSRRWRTSKSLSRLLSSWRTKLWNCSSLFSLRKNKSNKFHQTAGCDKDISNLIAKILHIFLRLNSSVFFMSCSFLGCIFDYVFSFCFKSHVILRISFLKSAMIILAFHWTPKLLGIYLSSCRNILQLDHSSGREGAISVRL